MKRHQRCSARSQSHIDGISVDTKSFAHRLADLLQVAKNHLRVGQFEEALEAPGFFGPSSMESSFSPVSLPFSIVHLGTADR